MVDMEHSCSDSVADIIADAVSVGDLDADRAHAGDIIFGLWSISLGFHRLVQSFDDIQQVGLVDAESAVKKNYCMLLDGYGWQPKDVWNAEEVGLGNKAKSEPFGGIVYLHQAAGLKNTSRGNISSCSNIPMMKTIFG